ncbi:MAG: zinc-binding dehydrogenase [Pirellulaceae bacterium]|nr:zinc-binding dehydrogenase [Pirellulaceae bacterium]
MKTQAAILVELARPLELVDLEIPALQPGQLLVEITFSGVCHTQLLEARGRRGADPYLPHCLGHEGAGVVVDTGPDVRRSSGDNVVLSWIKSSGANVPGSVYSCGGRPVNAGGVTTFSRHAVVSENRTSPLPPDTPHAVAALLGCAAPTGVGSVWNTANVQSGQSVVVLGVGGVGLCAVAAAAARRANPIVAVDRRPDRLQLARQMGATNQLNVDDVDWREQLAALLPGGVDCAIEASGRPEVMRTALECVRPQGGTAVVIGNAPHGEQLQFDPQQLNQGKRLLGTWGGDCVVERDIPLIAAGIQQRVLPIDQLVGKIYSLDAVNQALDDLEQGATARPLLDMSLIG